MVKADWSARIKGSEKPDPFFILYLTFFKIYDIIVSEFSPKRFFQGLFMKVFFTTFGCKVNQYETNGMIQKFMESNYDIVDFSEKADIYIINTCTVTAMGDKKSRQVIHTAKNNKSANNLYSRNEKFFRAMVCKFSYIKQITCEPGHKLTDFGVVIK